jgi:two-component system response regulator
MPLERHILLVEDNEDDIALTLRAFHKHGLGNPIDVARDGQEALRLLLDEGKPLPAVVLLDLKLPLIGGLGVLQKLREHSRTRTVPVVVLTSSNEDSDVVESYRLGANSYVRKPVDFGAFVDAAHHLGLYWLVLNQLPGEP